MPVRSVKNQYLGVNAHLHSFWQGAGKWNRFHDVYITHLMEAFKPLLLPMGYTAEIEESLQVKRISGEVYRPEADILISDPNPERAQQPPTRTGNGSHRLTVMELIDRVLEEDKRYSALALYGRRARQVAHEAVAWIELLSPTNKRKGADLEVYQDKRTELLDKGIVFVEIDYLHETPPTFLRLLDYSNRKQRHPEAHPYRIVILDPRPDVATGPADIHEFDVDEAIPKVRIPLNAGDVLEFDFNQSYQKTFESALYGYAREYDYTELPMNFDRYSEGDQTRIACRMLSVLEAARDGVDLETGPFPVKVLSLQDALTQIETLKKQLG